MSFAERLRATLPDVLAGRSGRIGFAAWDLAEGEPVTVQAERQVNAASTIKVLIMIAALRAVRDGDLALDTDLRLPDPADRAGGSGVLAELSGLRSLCLRDLITLMIVISDNAATNAVIDAVGIPTINDCALELGCEGTHLGRKLMDTNTPGRIVTTARDQARLLDRLAGEAALPPGLTQLALDVLARQQVRDRLPELLPGNAGVWNKTGELLRLRHDVGLIGRGRPQAVVAVLVDELDDERSSNGYRGGPACDTIAALGLAVYRALG